MDDFNIYCIKCGSDSIGLHFKHGTPNTKDIMIIYCKKCNNNNQVTVHWDRYCRSCGKISVMKVCEYCGYESLNKEV